MRDKVLCRGKVERETINAEKGLLRRYYFQSESLSATLLKAQYRSPFREVLR